MGRGVCAFQRVEAREETVVVFVGGHCGGGGLGEVDATSECTVVRGLESLRSGKLSYDFEWLLLCGEYLKYVFKLVGDCSHAYEVEVIT